jgi:hypothetical protein
MAQATKLTARQQSVKSAVAGLKKAGTTFVAEYAGMLKDYYEKDSHSPDCIEFLLSELVRQEMPRYFTAAKQLLALYIPVEVSVNKKTKAVTVINKKGVTKPQKAKMLEALNDYEWDKMTSILNHNKLKVTTQLVWDSKAKESVEAFLVRRLEAGAPLKDLLDIMQSAAKKAAKNVAEDADKAEAA